MTCTPDYGEGESHVFVPHNL